MPFPGHSRSVPAPRPRFRSWAATAVAASSLGAVAVAIAGVALLPPPAASGQAPPLPVAPPAAVTTPAAASTDTDPATLSTPCRTTTRACVQLSTQHVWLLADGRVVRDGFVSSGTTDMQTPTGTFHVRYKDATHYSRAYHTSMPYAVFFDDDGDALHQGSLARQSRGCVHLEHDDAVAFFDALHPGDEVQILP